jgi:hypothetical protein
MIEECVKALQKTKNTTIPQLPLEVAVVNICNNPTKPQDTPNDTNPKPNHKNPETKETQEKPKQSKPKKSNNKKAERVVTQDKQKAWKKCITKIEPQNKSLAHLLLQCNVKEINTKNIILTTTFSFYKDKILQAKNYLMIETAIKNTFNIPIKIEIIVLDKKQEKTNSSELLSYATQIMGVNPATE